MDHSRTNGERLSRRVSISSLPRLSRATTFDIEMHYFMKHVRHRARKAGKSCKQIFSFITRFLKYIAFAPCSPIVCFFVVADKVVMSMQHEPSDGSMGEISAEIIDFPYPEYFTDNYDAIITSTREVEGKIA
ncbi:hypothetical protein F5Y11DRAFT_129191 [Daldinia sp. FL1419]|nr:hypothetical protein F5Y11DRAFT_129191 [Daldinia sp. FL1419]